MRSVMLQVRNRHFLQLTLNLPHNHRIIPENIQHEITITNRNDIVDVGCFSHFNLHTLNSVIDGTIVAAIDDVIARRTAEARPAKATNGAEAP